MRSPYLKIFALSMLITIVLFCIDRARYSFTPASVAGYFIVGAVYVVAIFLVSSLLLLLYKAVLKLFGR